MGGAIFVPNHAVDLIDIPPITGEANKYLTVKPDESGFEYTSGATIWSQSGSDIYFNTGNVGIGTSAPTNLLHLVKSASSPTPGAETNDAIWGMYTFTGVASSPYTYCGSAIHLRTIMNGTGTVHTASLHCRLQSGGSLLQEITPLFCDTSSEDRGRIWGTDQNVFGPVLNQADLIMGASICVNNYNASGINNGGWGIVITSKPGAGGGDVMLDRNGRQTYPLDALLAVVGWSGTSSKSVDTVAAKRAIQIGGYAGGWMASPLTSRFETAINITDWTLYGIHISGRKSGATGPAIAIANGAGNIGLGTLNQFGGGDGVMGISDAITIPTSNPTGGGVIYVEAGALKYRGTSGTITTLGAA